MLKDKTPGGIAQLLREHFSEEGKLCIFMGTPSITLFSIDNLSIAETANYLLLIIPPIHHIDDWYLEFYDGKVIINFGSKEKFVSIYTYRKR